MMLHLHKSYRAQRMASKIQEIVAKCIPPSLEKRGLTRLQHPIVTKVIVTPDLRQASLYFICLNKADANLVTSHLSDACVELRKHMASLLKSKYVPEIRFILEENFNSC